MADQSMQNLTRDVEDDLLAVIIYNLKRHKIKADEAKRLAIDFLVLLPLADKKDLLAKLYALGQKHYEAKGVFLKYANTYEQEGRDAKLSAISKHIQNGQIEHAITVAKGGKIDA